MKELSNVKLADIGGIFGYNKSITDGITEFDDLFGLSVAPNKREFCLTHQTKILSRSHLDPEVTWVNLWGMGDMAIPIDIDSAASLKQVSFLAPPWEALVMVCTSMEGLNALAANAEDVEVKIHGTICIEPLLAEAEMNATSTYCTEI
jgi:hypothetical protein